MDTITVCGMDIQIPKATLTNPNDIIIVGMEKMAELQKRYENTIVLSAGYMTKDELELPLSKEDEDCFEKQYASRKQIKAEMRAWRERVRKAYLILKENMHE